MDDVLKLAEEALELVRGEVAHPMTTEAQNAYIDALAAIRAARAECGWMPIEDCKSVGREKIWVGRWQGSEWNAIKIKSEALAFYNATHFYIEPQLPPPPKEADHGKKSQR